MSSFVAELAQEVREARACEAAGRVTQTSKRRVSSPSPEVQAQRFSVAVMARIARAVQLVAVALQIVVLVWLGSRWGAGAVIVGGVGLGVLAALRVVVTNCVARRWRTWAWVSAAVAAMGTVGAVVWIVMVGQRPAVAVVFVASQVIAVAGRALIVEAQHQAGPEFVVV